jgi:hypothetical protein
MCHGFRKLLIAIAVMLTGLSLAGSIEAAELAAPVRKAAPAPKVTKVLRYAGTCLSYGCRKRIVWRGCSDRYSCYPLYGAYGPYGGVGYWAAYGPGWARY